MWIAGYGAGAALAFPPRWTRLGGVEDDAIRTLVARLARPHTSGGAVIERAAILAAGSDSGEVLAWITAHDAVPEEMAPLATGRGLHSSRLSSNARSGDRPPQRYVLPPGVLS
jgi:hypothetical protein